MKTVFSGDIFVLLDFAAGVLPLPFGKNKQVCFSGFGYCLRARGSHVLVTYTYASTVLVKRKSHPEAAFRPKFSFG
jgi:hypothetical protein